MLVLSRVLEGSGRMWVAAQSKRNDTCPVGGHLAMGHDDYDIDDNEHDQLVCFGWELSDLHNGSVSWFDTTASQLLRCKRDERLLEGHMRSEHVAGRIENHCHTRARFRPVIESPTQSRSRLRREMRTRRV